MFVRVGALCIFFQNQASYIWDSQESDWVLQTCQSIYPNNQSAIPLCVECADLVTECVPTPLILFIIGIILLTATWIPCFYFCCCSSAPKPEEVLFVQAPPGTYVSSSGPSAGQQQALMQSPKI